MPLSTALMHPIPLLAPSASLACPLSAGAFEGIGLALSVEGGKTFMGMPSEFKRRSSTAAGPEDSSSAAS